MNINDKVLYIKDVDHRCVIFCCVWHMNSYDRMKKYSDLKQMKYDSKNNVTYVEFCDKDIFNIQGDVSLKIIEYLNLDDSRGVVLERNEVHPIRFYHPKT